MAEADFYIKEGDVLLKIEATLKDENDAVVDLTGAAVIFKMKGRTSVTIKVDAAATIDDAVNGKVSYTWAAGDTDTAGDYHAEFEVTFTGGSVLTFPNDGYLEIKILSDL